MSCPTGIPEWVCDLRDLRGYVDDLTDLAGYVDELTDFASRPVDYIIEVVLTAIVGWFLTALRFVISSIQTAAQPLLAVPGTIASPLVSAGGLIVGAIASMLTTINDVIVTLSMVAGPASPIVVLVIWGLIALAALDSLRYLIRLLPLVIPWL